MRILSRHGATSSSWRPARLRLSGSHRGVRARRCGLVGGVRGCTINGLYKTELIKPRGPWRTVDQVEIATAEWVDWYNFRRLYRYCGDIPPAELETAYYAQNRAQPTAEFSNR